VVLAAKLKEYEGLGLSGGIATLVVPKVLVAQKPAAVA